LLAGEQMTIKPAGFDELHQRNAMPHRLNQDARKWKPYRADGSGDEPGSVGD
jgi:lysine 2,3-aminomutase